MLRACASSTTCSRTTADVVRLRCLPAAHEDPAALADIDEAEIGEGQTNDILHDIQVLGAKAATMTKPKAAAEGGRQRGQGGVVRGALQ